MISTLYSLFFDKNLRPYWASRALGAALSLIFGIILKSFGYDNTTVFLSLSLLYLSQGLALIFIDSIPVVLRSFISYLFCIIALSLSVYMFFFGINLLLICSIAVLLQYSIRESNNNGSSYIREKANWPLGVDVATAIANESGKGAGLLLIALIGVAMAISVDWLFAILALFSLAIIIYHPSPHLGSYKIGITNSLFNLSGLDSFGKRIVLLSSMHNGVIFGLQAFLAIALYDFISESSNSGNISGKIGLVFSTGILIGMLAYAYFKKKTVGLSEKITSARVLPISIFCMTLISGIAFLFLSLWQLGLIGTTQASLAIVISMGLMVSFGSLYTVGFLQLIDLSYKDLDLNDRIGRRISIMSMNTTLSRFTPAFAVLMIYVASVYFESLSDISFFIAGIAFSLEVIILYCFYRLSSEENAKSKETV